MKLNVQAYGIVRDIAGRAFEVEMQGNTVGELRQALIARYPDLSALASLMVAVNKAYATDEVRLQPDDEVVLIPPVSGG